ncbi:MAG: TaqI-like C-terminal specificity domain-containing protein [Bacteroidota bacterium]
MIKKQKKIKAQKDRISHFEKALQVKEQATNKDAIAKVAEQIASFDPYDQNLSAPFFESEWMFGLTDGFDIVIGNPPYGFRTVLSKDEKDYFRKVKQIEFSSGDSAELFCKISFNQFVKTSGILTFIIPKKSLYGDAWEDLRLNYWKKFDLAFILDTGKSFENVLLEASVFGLIKSSSNRKVELAFLESDLTIQKFENTQKEFFFLENNTCQIYKVLYPVSLFQKIKTNSFDSKKITTKLGLAIGQDFFSETKTKHKLLKGIDVEKYNVRSHRYLKNFEKLKWENVAAFQKPKVITQVIVSHIENPNPHLKIIACYDAEGIAITNTLMAFETDNDIDLKFLLGYLNSKFVSWYAYNFIYSQAIRTMHFYDFYIQQLPVPKVAIKDQKPFITLVDKILSAKEENAKADTSKLEKQIDEMVYKLYELTEEEVQIIEGKKN